MHVSSVKLSPGCKINGVHCDGRGGGKVNPQSRRSSPLLHSFLPLSVVGISDIMIGNDGGLVNRNITFTAFGEPAVFSVGIDCLTLIL